MHDATKRLRQLSRRRIPHVEEYYDRLEYETDAVGAFRLRRNQRLPHVRINADGFRGRPFTGEEIILLLGDSVTFGVGASGDEACFARFLEREGAGLVADASIRGYRVWQHCGQLPLLLHRLPRTRQVLLWCGYVDLAFWMFTGGCVEGAFEFDRKYMPGRLRQRLLARIFWRLQRIAWVAATTRAITGQRPAVTLWRKGSLEQLTEELMLYVRAMRDLCAARQIAFHLLLQPFVRSRPAPAELRLLVDAHDSKVRAACGRSWYDGAPQFAQLLREALARDGTIAWFDGQPHVEEDDFIDQVHLREAALIRLAQQVARATLQAPRDRKTTSPLRS